MTYPPIKSRGLMGYGGGVLAGVVSAGLLLTALGHAGTLLVLLAYLVPVPLYFIGFSSGLGAMAVSGVCVCAACLFLGPIDDILFFSLIDFIPALGLLALSLQSRAAVSGKTTWGSEGRILTAAVSYPALVFLGIYGATWSHPGGLLAMTHTAFEGMSDQIGALLVRSGETVTPATVALINQYLDFAARMAPALLMCAWLFATLIAIIVAQMLAQQRGWSLRPSFQLHQLHVPNWVTFAVAVTGLIGSFAPAPYNYVGYNLALVTGVPFFFCGLAVIHAWAKQTRAPMVYLTVFYIILSVVVHLVLLVALVGAVDQWVDFRKRFAEKGQNK